MNNIIDIYSLTPSQEGIYAQYFQNKSTQTYQLQSVIKIDKNASPELLEKSLELLSVRHRVLKSAFTVLKTGAIKQVILADRKPEFTVVQQNEAYSQELLDRIVSDDGKRTMDLQKDSLFRAVVIDFSDERYVLFHAHHIIIDGWCLPIIINDLQSIYSELANGKPEYTIRAEIEKKVSAETSYAEYSGWIRKQNIGEISAYWDNLLSENVPSHIYGKEKTEITDNGKIITFRRALGTDSSESLEAFAKDNRVSANTVFESALGIALQKFSGSDDVVFDKIISGRGIPLKGIESTVGLFINTVPVRIKAHNDSKFSDLLKEIQKQTTDANINGILSLAEVYRSADIDSKAIDTLFVFENYYSDESEIERGSLSAKSIAFNEQTEFNLTIAVVKDKSGYTLRVSYDENIYTEDEIDGFVNGYISLLTASLDSEALIKDISVLNESEGNKILNDFNDTKYEYDIPENSTLYSLFEKASEENKEKVCLVADNKEITFGEFKSYAERIDSRIRNITNEEKSVIAVICERSFEMYGAVYGIIRGGNAYLPIAPDYPQERIDYILENSNAKAVVTQDKFCHLVRNIPCINATDILESKETVDSTPILANEDDTAYVIYTSGSTGNPKGAKISHKSAVNRTLWMHDFYPLEENDVILQKTPYTFDVSVWELFWWGIKGRTLCASKPDEHFLPAKILNETEKNRVTHLHFVPSVFDIFLTYLENNPDEQYKFNSVKYVFLSGEALSANSIRRFYNIYDYNKVSLHNLYGPTECAVDVSYYPCVPTDVDPVPIGKPIYNTQLYIVDKNLNPTPIGVIGELCIGGVNVGQGYLNNETLTNEKFIDNPFHEGKIYKTGDLAYWRNDGQICYAGRMDNQIKLNGQRIELGEIENAITEIDGVESVAVIVRQNEGKDILVAFCCGKVEKSLIKAHCEDKLPRYMVPGAFAMLERMPLNPSGKLDRKQLKSVHIEYEKAVREKPVNETEKMICTAFENILHRENVGRNESFFDLGGTSIDMISILSESQFTNVTATQFIANSTPEKLAHLMTEGDKVFWENIDVLRAVDNSQKALVLVPYAGGDATAFAKLVDSISKYDDDLSVYYVDYLHSYEECEAVAAEIAEIAKSQRLCFYSHCAGASVALQLINILEKNGVEIERYISGGYIPPSRPPKKNFWNSVSDKYISKKLVSAGAPLEKFSDEQNHNMIDKFRKDTDFMTLYHYKNAESIKVTTDVVISKTDPFTKNYKDTEKLWKRTAENFNKIYYIESNSHYFQSDNSDVLAEIILKITNQ